MDKKLGANGFLWGDIGKMGRIENCLLEWGEFFVVNLWYKTTRDEQNSDLFAAAYNI